MAKSDQLPYFQQLQQEFAAHIRDPEQNRYAPEGEKPIESRRLEAYQSLFFNNVESFFSQIFPVCRSILGDDRWMELVRDYMRLHQAQTPLFHELGQEFLDFLQTEYEPKAGDPEFLLELAHYEWVELALTVATDPAMTDDESDASSEGEVDLTLCYACSELAWPLAYEWPVHQLSDDYQPEQKPEQATTLLIYRKISDDDDRIEFMELTPLLYQFLTSLDGQSSAQSIFEGLAQSYQLSFAELEGSAKESVQALLQLSIIRPL